MKKIWKRLICLALMVTLCLGSSLAFSEETGKVTLTIGNTGSQFDRKGIKVELSVSTGKVFSEVPDVVNLDYREAKNRLQQAGFVVDIENETSNSVTKDYVISTSPSAGEQMSSGSTVYVTVSTGPQISYVRMPNVIGLSEDAAMAKLESAGLSFGGSDRITSDVDAGTVIGQSADAFTEVEEHSKIYLKVSSGPLE